MATTWSAAKPGMYLSFYDNPLLSDVTIKFGEHKIFAHKFILSQKSKYFYTAFTGSFLEARTSVIDLGNDDEPACVRSLIEYIYNDHDDFVGDHYKAMQTPKTEVRKPKHNEDEKGDEDEEDEEVIAAAFLFLTQLFVTADKYDVPTLRELIVSQVTDVVLNELYFEESTKLPIVEAIQIIYGHVGDDSLQLATTKSFADAAYMAWHDEEGFGEVVDSCGELAAELLKALSVIYDDPTLVSLMGNEAFRQLICDTPALGRDLMFKTVARFRRVKDLFKCRTCERITSSTRRCYHCSITKRLSATKKDNYRFKHWPEK